MATSNGSIVVASSGNGNAGLNCGGVNFSGYGYPASLDNTISVSGTTSSDDYATNGGSLWFTFNDKVDLTAPGWNLTTSQQTLSGQYELLEHRLQFGILVSKPAISRSRSKRALASF